MKAASLQWYEVMLWFSYCFRTRGKCSSAAESPNGSSTTFWLSKHNGLTGGVISCIKPLVNSAVEEKRMIPLISLSSIPASFSGAGCFPPLPEEMAETGGKCLRVPRGLLICCIHMLCWWTVQQIAGDLLYFLWFWQTSLTETQFQGWCVSSCHKQLY